jgi:DNA-3-methyladenine glycosylase
VKRGFYDADARDVAPRLLNKVLVAGPVSGRIVEVEAYAGADDPGAHSYRGMTPRNATMFGRPGLLYVYFTYGMHFCANAVCGPGATPTAVLIRGLTPLTGVELMRARRPKARGDAELCAGPGRICQALGLTRDHDGADLVAADGGVTILDDGTPPPTSPGVSTRIGLREGAGDTFPWRFTVPGAVGLSRKT